MYPQLYLRLLYATRNWCLEVADPSFCVGEHCEQIKDPSCENGVTYIFICDALPQHVLSLVSLSPLPSPAAMDWRQFTARAGLNDRRRWNCRRTGCVLPLAGWQARFSWCTLSVPPCPDHLQPAVRLGLMNSVLPVYLHLFLFFFIYLILILF